MVAMQVADGFGGGGHRCVLERAVVGRVGDRGLTWVQRSHRASDMPQTNPRRREFSPRRELAPANVSWPPGSGSLDRAPVDRHSVH